MAYNYIKETYEDVSSIDENLVLLTVTKDSLESGIKAAQIALKDVGTTESTPGSRTGPRIDQYLANIGCRPTLGEWSVGAIATWCIEAGLPIPPSDSSSANGWYVWAKKTNRWLATPVIGSVAVYGTKNDDGTETFNAHHLGLVIQADEEDNVVITCENVNGEIAQAQSDIDSLLGFILPSKTDIQEPKITYEEQPDTSKEGHIDESIEYTAETKDLIKDYIKEVVNKVLSGGENKGWCAKGTYNHAHQFIRKLQGKAVESGMKYAAGGNANGFGYHKELQRLGYAQTDYGTVTFKELTNSLNNSNSWNIGDVAVYWAVSGVAQDVACRKYGHTQMFTGGKHSNATSKWTTDNRNNYGCAMVYPRFTNTTWRFIKFSAPTTKYIS